MSKMLLQVTLLSGESVRVSTMEGHQVTLVPNTPTNFKGEGISFASQEVMAQFERHVAAAGGRVMTADEIADTGGANKPANDGDDPDRTIPGMNECLLGSSVQPATFDDLSVPIDGGDVVLASTVVNTTGYRNLQLGDIVAKAQADSGMTVEEWNAQSEADREEMLALIVDETRTIAAENSKPKSANDTSSESAPGEGTNSAPPPDHPHPIDAVGADSQMSTAARETEPEMSAIDLGAAARAAGDTSY